MNEYSGVKGAELISSVSDRVWRIQKKRKLSDRKRREGKGDQKEKPENTKDISLENEPTDDAADDPLDHPVGYGSLKMKKRLRKRIDLII